MTLTAAQVLDQHARLADRMRTADRRMASFCQTRMVTAIEDTGPRVVSMFFPALPMIDDLQPDEVTREHGAHLSRVLGAGLSRAVTFQVTAEMVDAMYGIWQNDPVGPELIHLAEVPCEAGFAWFDEPWRIGGDDAFKIRAMSWDLIEALPVRGIDKHAFESVLDWPVIRASLWVWDEDVPIDLERGGSDLGPLVLTHSALIPLNYTIERDTSRDEGRADSFLSLIHLLWMFIGMEIVSSAPVPVERHTRRRAQRFINTPAIRVITLRRVRHDTDTPGTTRHVEWSCRWIVQGHYRHMEKPEQPHRAVASGADKHCAICGGQLQKWIKPFIKGPDGMPLRVTEQTVYKLAR